jgi:hypothetical protein
MTKYIKTGTTEFEQFNGSDEMMDKYVIEEWPYNYFVIKTLEGNVFFAIGDWIATGVNGEHWPVKDEIFQKTYKKLPKLTRPVSRYLEYCKEHWNLNDAFLNAEYLVPNNNGALEVFEYLSERPDEFARAWLDSYEVVEAE